MYAGIIFNRIIFKTNQKEMRYEYDTRVVGGGINYPSDDHPLAEISKEIQVKMISFLKKHRYSFGNLEFVIMDTGRVNIINESGETLVRDIPTCRVDISIIHPMMKL